VWEIGSTIRTLKSVKAIVKHGDRIYVHIANFFSEAFFLGRPMGLWLWVREGEGGKYEDE